MIRSYHAGFTLIELSIVLVVIALLISGVITGQKMIENARIQKIIYEIQDYQSVFSAFYENYKALPGDMIDATAVLPNGGTTSNGDGDRTILWDSSTTPSEGLLAWQHIELAEMMHFGGMPGSSTGNDAIVDETIPNSTVSPRLGFGVYTTSGVTQFIVGANDTSSHLNTGGYFTPLNLYSIDQKLDDGEAGSGAVSGGGTNCISGGYNVGTDAKNCYLTVQVDATL